TPFSIYEGIHVSVHDLMILMCVGISAAIAQFSVTLSYSAAETRVVSIYGYTQIIFAAILGIIFFGEVPDALSVAGYVTIIAGALIKQGFGKR
ncbi:MAG: EamA family transporter, partial [Eubacteriales bacterium]|nr:EamA family transporter [Eubacteriales bacterium]